MSFRVLVAGLFHETHTFLDGLTRLEDFQRTVGKEMLTCCGDSSPLGGVLDLAQQYGWQIIPTADYRAQPSATVEDRVIDSFLDCVLPLVSAGGFDAIYLVLHGAMVTQSLLDVEGEVLKRIREHTSVPIFGVFDLHANFSTTMASLADCLVGYRENPHTDARESAVRVAKWLQHCLTTGQRPQMSVRHSGLLWPPTGTATASDPMLSLERLARRFEVENPALWEMSVVGGFSFSDTPHTGVSFVASGLGDFEKELESLVRTAKELDHLGRVTDPPVDEVLASLKPQPQGLTVLVEPSDNIGGGAPGDGTGLLRAMIAYGVDHAAICICDPESVRDLENGVRVIRLGGKGSRLDAGPLQLEVELLGLRNGRFELEDKNSHLASMCGDWFDMGRCALVRHAGLIILITSIKTPPFDLGQWRSQGVDPEKLSIIAVKAAVAHRKAYDPIAARMLWVDTPGPCSSNLSHFPYQHLLTA